MNLQIGKNISETAKDTQEEEVKYQQMSKIERGMLEYMQKFSKDNEDTIGQLGQNEEIQQQTQCQQDTFNDQQGDETMDKVNPLIDDVDEPKQNLKKMYPIKTEEYDIKKMIKNGTSQSNTPTWGD